MSKLYTTVVFIVIGFSNAEVIGYLVREVLVTTGLGIMLGLLIGIPATSVIIRSVESDGFMFLGKTYASAWILAASKERLHE